MRKILLLCLMAALLCGTALAVDSTGDVASVVESTWKDAAAQIKTVVDNVVFPALDMILAIAFFGKLSFAYFDYKSRGHFEWAGPVPLCLPDPHAHRAAVHLDHRGLMKRVKTKSAAAEG